MARPKTARLQTAYDLGHEHGRTGSRPRAADDIIGGDPDLQRAYDDGLQDGTDSLDTPSSTTTSSKPHRPRPISSSGGGRRTTTQKASKAARSSTAPASPTSKGRFSHPLHWGSGARGQVVGRPTLRPPSRFAMRDWTGFGFGLFLYALGSAYITYGPGGPTAWLKAKFLNDTSSAPPPRGGAGAAPALPAQPQTRTVPSEPVRPPQLAPTPTPAPGPSPQATS